LRHRVKDDRAGDLERRDAALAIEEDFCGQYFQTTYSAPALPAAVSQAASDHHLDSGAHQISRAWVGGARAPSGGSG